MAERDNETRGRLGRLFAALAGDDGPSDAHEGSDDSPDAGTHSSDGSSLDVEELSQKLLSSSDPVPLLVALMHDVRVRAEGAGTPGHEGMRAPGALELRLAERLEEAGLDSDDVKLPSLHVVRPRTSGLFYLRVDEESLAWLAKLEVLRVEAALNAALLTGRLLPDANRASASGLVRAEQRICRSIVSQAERVAAHLDEPAHGEWAVRHALAYGIEAFQLPYRLTASFRVNVVAGAAAFEVDLVPPRAWTSVAFVGGLGVVPATSEMRRAAATDYNLRLAVLLAGYAFAVAPELDQVWVAGVVDTAADHACYYSVRLTRTGLVGVDLTGALDPLALLRASGAVLEGDERGLSAVRQGFSLEDELFCPARRHDPVELSDAVLDASAARALGCARVSGLSIDEGQRRRHVASELSRGLTDSTEDNVRLLLSAAGEGALDDVAQAARRCVAKLIDGTLADDPIAVEEEFVDGDPLSRAAAKAHDLLVSRDFAGAQKVAEEGLAQAENDACSPAGASERLERAFGTYADRALYNRLVGPGEPPCALASSPSLDAHAIASAAELAQGLVEEALAHARHVAEVAPLSAQASLHLSHCLEAAGDVEGSERELCRLLALAHDPESIGLGYLRVAQLEWQQGHVLAAQACYQRALRYLPAPTIMAGLAFVTFVGQASGSGEAQLPDDQADAVLEAAGIPLAPTREVSDAFLEAARAAVDSELFGVARDLMQTLCTMSRDDVYFGMLRSIEDAPDR